MPIDSALLNRLESNDPSLESLNLSYKELNNSDVQNLIKALALNTTLKTLNVSGSRLGVEGAKALATNTILTTLDVRFNQLGNEGAKALAANTILMTLDVSGNLIGVEGAKALAANTTLMTLNVSGNSIGDEGAKALAANTTLTTLNVGFNWLGDEANQQLSQAIARNQEMVSSRRNQFLRKLILLASDKANEASKSLWSCLPKEVMLHIIGLIDFRSLGSIGKNPGQIKACAAFIFNHTPQMRASLAVSVKTRQAFKLMEKVAQGKSQFRFFPPAPSPSITTGEKAPEQQENANAKRSETKPEALAYSKC